jgi:hypothetical protein
LDALHFESLLTARDSFHKITLRTDRPGIPNAPGGKGHPL